MLLVTSAHLFALFFVSAYSNDAVQVKQLVVFGDGFSDNGVDLESEDGHGFGAITNGKTWSDHLARLMFEESEGPGCYKNKLINYAYRGAQTGWDNQNFNGWSGLLWQVEQFDCHCRTDENIKDCTIIIQMPGLEMLRNSNGYLEVPEMLEDFKTAIDILINRGAKNIFILGLMDPSNFPKYNGENWSQIVREFNEKAFDYLYSRKCKQGESFAEDKCYEGMRFSTDVFKVLKKRLDIVNTTLSQQLRDRDSNIVTRGRYNQWHRYLWFDNSHLTNEGHKELASMLHSAITMNPKETVPSAASYEEETDEATEDIRLNIFRRL